VGNLRRSVQDDVETVRWTAGGRRVEGVLAAAAAAGESREWTGPAAAAGAVMDGLDLVDQDGRAGRSVRHCTAAFYFPRHRHRAYSGLAVATSRLRRRHVTPA